MRLLKKLGSVAVYFILISFSLTVLSCAKKEKVKVLNMGHGLDITHPVHKAMLFMAEKAAEKSEGKLKINVYPSEQLGNEKESIEKLQLGALALTKVSTSPLESFVEEYKVFAMPYLFRDAEHRWMVFNGPIGKELLAAGESKGVKGLVYYDAGARSFYTRDKPILHPDNLEGLKIRTQQSPMAIEMIRALGGSATPISWGELYTSLQQGVVDGAENNPPSVYTSRHYEVCRHYSLDEHTGVPDVVLVSMIIWNSLDPALQKALQEAADESVPYQRKLWDDFIKESMEKMTSAGLEVYYPDKEPFRERARNLWEKYKDTEMGALAMRIQEVQ